MLAWLSLHLAAGLLFSLWMEPRLPQGRPMSPMQLFICVLLWPIIIVVGVITAKRRERG